MYVSAIYFMYAIPGLLSLSRLNAFYLFLVLFDAMIDCGKCS